MLDANTLCGTEPESWLTTTTVYLDRDFVVDQVFWQYAEAFAHRLDAKRFLDSYYTEPAQVMRLGEDHAGMLMPWLEELSSLSAEGLRPERFYRAQSLLFAVLDVVVPHLVVTGHRVTPSQRAATCPSLPLHRQFAALRTDARQAAKLLRDEYQRAWTLTELADAVHLSRSQLGRVFVEAFGKSPIAYCKGYIRYKGATYKGTHEAIVPREVWYQVQAVLGTHRSAADATQIHDHYLKGTVFCGQCGYRLLVSNAKNHQGKIYPYFVCSGRQSGQVDCTRQAMLIEDVEHLIEDYYKRVQITPDIAWPSLGSFTRSSTDSWRPRPESWTV